MSFLPPENTALQNLLAIIADPTASAQRLEEAKTTQDQLNKTLDDVRQAQSDLEKKQAILNDSIKQEAALKAENQGILTNLQKEWKDKIDALNKERTDFFEQKSSDMSIITNRQSVLDSKSNDIASREAAVSVKEKELADRETKIKAHEDAVNSFKNALDDKLNNLKKIIQ